MCPKCARIIELINNDIAILGMVIQAAEDHDAFMRFSDAMNDTRTRVMLQRGDSGEDITEMAQVYMLLGFYLQATLRKQAQMPAALLEQLGGAAPQRIVPQPSAN